MDNVLPLLFCCVGPILWGGFMFLVGRYSMTHTLQMPAVRRRGEQPVYQESPFFKNFEEQ